MYYRPVSWILCLLLALVDGQHLVCKGWGGEQRIVPDVRINDGYCDCPRDGADEPNTEACAGSSGWPGISGNEHDVSNAFFQCPQQPKVQLPLSRINDGICDCCDGADEEMACPDVCEEILVEERAARAKIKEAFSLGYEKRQTALKEFEELRQDTLKQIGIKKKELDQVETEEQECESELRSAKSKYVTQRVDVVKGVYKEMESLVKPLSQDELIAFIVQSCQLSGEQESRKGSTCVPLRLAGMDMGFVWENESIEMGKATFRYLLEEDKDGFETIADLMDKHFRGEELDWSLERNSDNIYSQKRQRETRRYSDDDDVYDYEDDDIYDSDEDEDIVHDRRGSGTEGSGESDDKGQLQREVQKSHLSKLRGRFLKHAGEFVHKIDHIKDEEDENEGDEDEEDEDEEDEAEDSADARKPDMGDPMALQMIKNTLKRRQESIERGFDYATSAKVLLHTLTDQPSEDLERVRSWLADLAVGTLFHGKIRAQDVWQLVVMNVAEFGYEPSDAKQTCVNDDETCGQIESVSLEDHMARICPPRIIESRGTPFPPEVVVSTAHSLCRNWSTNPLASDCGPVMDTELPTSIPDGYCGYVETQPRDETDGLSGKFAPLESLKPSPEISDLTDKLQTIRESHKDVDNELHELYENIGGEKQNKFGTNGELHLLRDQCSSTTAGKYIYEVCFFGKATQRDSDDKNGRGTDLGRWKGMTIDEETGERTMKWDGGAKCWNGPQRSATVHVTCGVETKVFSAEEPDTCRYVLEMESPIACDDAYKKHFGL